MKKNKNHIINLMSVLLLQATSLVISFWLSPFVIENIGIEANGFVTLANNFVSYAVLIVGALNSMSTRFITIEYVKGDYNRANLYYNSVLWGKWTIVAVLLLPAIFCVVNLENVINVPTDVVLDVKILFTLVFFNFFLQVLSPNWDCGTYITNKLSRTYVPNAIFSVFRCIMLVMLMTHLVPRIWFLGLVSLILTVLSLTVSCYNTHKLTPYLKIYVGKKNRMFSFSVIKELLSSGIWNTVSDVGSILLNNIDLLICNLFIGPTEMGILALSKVLPNLMQSVATSVRGIFAPNLLIEYAKGNKEEAVKDIRKAMKLLSVIVGFPVVGVVVMCREFYQLWVPNQNADLLSTLTIIACLCFSVICGIQILYNVFLVVNKVKENAIMLLISGGVSALITFVLLSTTSLGVYAVVGVHSVVNLLLNLFFTVPYTAKYLGLKPTTFYPQVLLCVISTAVLTVIGFTVKSFFVISSWISFFGVAALLGVLFIAINFFIFLNKDERNFLLSKIRRNKKSKIVEQN